MSKAPSAVGIARRARLFLLFAARTLYRALLRKTSAGRWLARQASAMSLFSVDDIHNATFLVDSVVGDPLRRTHFWPAISKRWGKLVFATPNRNSAGGYVPAAGILPWFNPLNCVCDPLLAGDPRINVLLPSIQMRNMSGGANTALIIAAGLAAAGFRIRLVSADTKAEPDHAIVLRHIEALAGDGSGISNIEICDASDRTAAFPIGPHDLFFATAWWTAQMAKYAARLTRYRQFIYLIQDFEPVLHDASSSYALALETYGLPHIPVVNSRLLHEYLAWSKIGRYSDPGFVASALVFEPAVDRKHFYPIPRTDAGQTSNGARTLLFYARPRSAHRNLFELGVAALSKLASEGILESARWQVLAMGDRVAPMPLSDEMRIQPLPWASFEGYARMMREADLVLALQMSPHPGYPSLEIAACGKFAVTTSFETKTQDSVGRISPNIIVAPPTIEGIADAIADTVRRIESGESGSEICNLPASWPESLREVLPALIERINGLRRQFEADAPASVRDQVLGEHKEYARYRAVQLAERRSGRSGRQQPGLLSFVTTVFDTAPEYLRELIASVLLQDGGTEFEWVILDNGSTEPATRAVLEGIAWHPCVRLHRVEKNLGIVGGMRYCLEKASGRYVLPLDSDDVIAPDCALTFTDAILRNGHPPLLYSDEDKLLDGTLRDPYCKPDWDPVLFVNSCYIAHLCAIDRSLAIALGAYSDAKAEGCHDWDSFMRFLLAGHVPHHIPEILYTWRMHRASTAGNIDSKPFVFGSHRSVLEKFRASFAQPGLFELVESPLFKGTPDWWFRRQHTAPLPLATVHIGKDRAGPRAPNESLTPLDVAVSLPSGSGIAQLAAAVSGLPEGIDVVRLTWDGVEEVGEESYWEAIGLFAQFPDAVMAGGPVIGGNRILAGGLVFGFAGVCGNPDAGRTEEDPGYFAQMRKQHTVSAVSSAHCFVKRSFLADACEALRDQPVTPSYLGPWLGAAARRSGGRVIFSPFIRSRASTVPEASASVAEMAAFGRFFSDLIPEPSWYSPALGVSAASAYQPVAQGTRQSEIARAFAALSDYPAWLKHDLETRSRRYALTATPPALCLITTVYPGSDAPLLLELADSIRSQTMAPSRWLIVAHGGIGPELRSILERLVTEQRATVEYEAAALTITGAMRRALAQVREPYFVPVDSDDLLTPDALQILAAEIVRRNQPELLYSDEDLLIEGQPRAPYRKPDYDPVLNLESSYIWHLCAIKTEAARRAGLYSDDGAAWCHDWDTTFRMQDAGCRIEHVAEILYHWRRHPASTSNQSTGSELSLQSVRHVLQGRISRLAGDDFEVGPYPINRGMQELYLARKPRGGGNIALIHHREQPGGPSAGLQAPRRQSGVPVVWTADVSEGDPAVRVLGEAVRSGAAIVGIFDGAVTLDLEAAYWEAVRLFELHPDLVGVGGRVCSKDGKVWESCRVRDSAGTLCAPYANLKVEDGGPFALALKAHTVARLSPRLAFWRTSFLDEQLRNVGPERGWLGAMDDLSDAAQRPHRLAYTPIIIGIADPVLTRGQATGAPRRPGTAILGLANYVACHGMPPG